MGLTYRWSGELVVVVVAVAVAVVVNAISVIKPAVVVAAAVSRLLHVQADLQY